MESVLTNFPMCPSAAVAELFRARPDSMSTQLIQTQFITQLFVSSYMHRGCWFWRVFDAPEELVNELLPTMPANEMKMIAGAGIRDITRWYKCKNGHAFAVGQCGMTMELSKCHCGETIGGQNHRKHESVQEANITDMSRDDEPGYNKEFVQSDQRTVTYRDTLTPFGVQVVSLCMHAMLALRCAVGAVDEVCKLVGYKDPNQTIEFVMKQFNGDWAACMKNADVNHTELGQLLSGVLHNANQNAETLMAAGQFHKSSPESRDHWERSFMQQCIAPLLNPSPKAGVKAHAELLDRYFVVNQKDVVVQLTGRDLWDEIDHLPSRWPADSHPSLERMLLRYAVPVELAHFKRTFAMNPSSAVQFPTLKMIVNQAEDLTIIQHLPAILGWHAVLFDVFQGDLDRKTAMKKTNGDVLRMVAESKRHDAKKIFKEFCKGFNAVFPTITDEFYQDWNRQEGVGMGCFNKNPFTDGNGGMYVPLLTARVRLTLECHCHSLVDI